ncbi:NUMOD4 motif-containing protein [Lutibacter oricola]|uniref:NUMOD4 motif-containing protein n=1 Tax=Lutibacter oricola TaxID=762486 RepID=A0A1H3D0H0_9FLAO|nr:HNH endonuclease [Lutibacter oricola]SDX59891.1 NUMOD4 motif-containing protein [Lutibacter oricola]
MIVDFRNEEWKPYRGEDWVEEDEYLISNYGRVKRKKITDENWKLSKTSLISGYDSFWISKKHLKSTTSCYVHRIVAKLFAEKREDQIYVTHLDFDKLNNEASNLKWMNRAELTAHQLNSPYVKKRKGKRTYSKLTEGRVKLIKKKIFDPNRKTRMRIIAKQFGISEMQLYRIKSGENWGSVTID